MLRFIIFSLLVAVASAASIAPFGPVGGAVSCGSKGQLTEVRITACTSAPCDLIVGRHYTIEVDFITFTEHESTVVLFSLISNGKEYELANIEFPIPLKAGMPYTVAYLVEITEEHVKGNVAIRAQVSDGDLVELCALAPAVIHN